MKAIITIIILALVAWGIWWFVSDNNGGVDTNDVTGQVNNSFDDILDGTSANDNSTAGTSTDSTDENSGFNDKG